MVADRFRAVSAGPKMDVVDRLWFAHPLASLPSFRPVHWQLAYRLRDPVRVEKGSRLEVTIHFDNSVNNAANPDAKQVIRWGDRTEEEMMTSWIEYLDATPARASLKE